MVNGSLNETKRLRNITDDFMKFSRLDKLNKRKADINQILTECIQFFKLKLERDILINTNIDKTLPTILADPAQITILINNLLENASHSIKGKGEISVRSNFIEEFKENDSLNINEYVEIEITDSGNGIAEKNLGKIFEPFYTTKEGGSGLGMVICKQIVDDHNGQIQIFSKINFGTSVRIKLPVS